MIYCGSKLLPQKRQCPATSSSETGSTAPPSFTASRQEQGPAEGYGVRIRRDRGSGLPYSMVRALYL